MIERLNRGYLRLIKQAALISQRMDDGILSYLKLGNLSWEEYFWGDREPERYYLPIK